MKQKMLYVTILILGFVGVFAWIQYSELYFLSKETGKSGYK